ncbi:hypothetical protein AVEN_128435-1 [Araneus ventricosus]|uniref:Mariner Mos1 transposase n=1 Tax=Araneus ventricosus TaxID=182803 RepID=A0A4Y2GI30_ARAVE|nr:hypothetical protein AVEN_128435-1 [Araneus ventricosus]
MVFIVVPPPPKNCCLTKSKIETLLIVFFDSKGLIHREFVFVGTTVNAESYQEVLKWLLQRIRQVWPRLYQSRQWKLLHGNARLHTAIRVRHFLTTHKVTVLEHPPYSPDLAPADFLVFPRLKGVLKGLRFFDITQFQQRCFERYQKKCLLTVSINCTTDSKVYCS